MDDKKKLVIVIAALAVLLVVSVAVYDNYKDRVDPATGTVVTGASQAMHPRPSARILRPSPATAFSLPPVRSLWCPAPAKWPAPPSPSRPSAAA